MISSAFLGQFLGIYILALSTVFLVRHESVSEYLDEFAELVSLRYNIAFVELGAGLAIVLGHQVWTLGYEGVITLIGWLMLGESVFHLSASEEQERSLIEYLDKERYWKAIGAVSVLLGIYLVTRGFTVF